MPRTLRNHFDLVLNNEMTMSFGNDFAQKHTVAYIIENVFQKSLHQVEVRLTLFCFNIMYSCTLIFSFQESGSISFRNGSIIVKVTRKGLNITSSSRLSGVQKSTTSGVIHDSVYRIHTYLITPLQEIHKRNILLYSNVGSQYQQYELNDMCRNENNCYCMYVKR